MNREEAKEVQRHVESFRAASKRRAEEAAAEERVDNLVRLTAASMAAMSRLYTGARFVSCEEFGRMAAKTALATLDELTRPGNNPQ
jgi:hypothetical protein